MSEQTRQYWIDTVLGWAQDRLMPPQYDECVRALQQGAPLTPHGENLETLTAELEDSRIDASDTAGQLRDALSKLAAAEQRASATRELLSEAMIYWDGGISIDDEFRAQVDAVLSGTSPVGRPGSAAAGGHAALTGEGQTC